MRRQRSAVVAILLSGIGAMATFGLAHQVLVAPAFGVFFGVPGAIVLSAPLVLAYRRLVDAGTGTPLLAGPAFGLVVASGLVVQFALVMLAMRGRTFDQGPQQAPYLLSMAAAPLVSAGLLWTRAKRAVATALVALGTGLAAIVIADFQASEPDAANVGALVATVLACAAAGWIAERTSVEAPVVVPPPHPGWVRGAPG